MYRTHIVLGRNQVNLVLQGERQSLKATGPRSTYDQSQSARYLRLVYRHVSRDGATQALLVVC